MTAITKTIDRQARVKKMIDLRVQEESRWLPHDRRGRWGVMEPGVGKLLRESPRAVRAYIDRQVPRRARRFSSLSRARAFARETGGEVFRWRSAPPGGGYWRRESPWERIHQRMDFAFGGILQEVLL